MNITNSNVYLIPESDKQPIEPRPGPPDPAPPPQHTPTHSALPCPPIKCTSLEQRLMILKGLKRVVQVLWLGSLLPRLLMAPNGS